MNWYRLTPIYWLAFALTLARHVWRLRIMPSSVEDIPDIEDKPRQIGVYIQGTPRPGDATWKEQTFRPKKRLTPSAGIREVLGRLGMFLVWLALLFVMFMTMMALYALSHL